MADKEKQLTGYPSIDKPWLRYYDAEFLTQPVPAMNIYTYMRSMTEKYDNLTALSYYGKEITYKELYEHIEETAKVLVSIGVQAGDRIMYLMPNIPETAYFLYGGARVGAVADYIDPRPDSLDFTVSAQKVLAMICEEKVKYLVALEQCYIAMLRPIESELLEQGIEQIILVKASSSMDKKAKTNYVHEVMEFNGFWALIKSIVKMKHISKLIKDARNTSLLKLSDYQDMIDENRNIVLPPVKYIKIN